jgi:hypothetical protein
MSKKCDLVKKEMIKPVEVLISPKVVVMGIKIPKEMFIRPVMT